jgi:transposase
MLKFNVIGIDLAKNVLQICVISKHGELVSNKMASRQKLKEVLAKSSPSIVGIEGGGSSHYWGRLAESFSHDIRFISPKKVKDFLEGHKTDVNDALAIANAAMQISLNTVSAVRREVVCNAVHRDKSQPSVSPDDSRTLNKVASLTM